MCVIKLANAADATSKFPGQSKYVPWLICMDSHGDPVDKCNKQVGVDSAAVQQCLTSDAPALLKQYLSADASIRGTPTVYVNGAVVKKNSYSAIVKAICKADSTLSGCSAAMPDWAEYEHEASSVPDESEVEGNACLSAVNGYRARKGLPAYRANDGKNQCTAGQAANDKVHGWHKAFGKCGEHGQCEAEGNSDCAGAIKQYWNEGPGGGHYDIIMSKRFTTMSWGRSGNFWTHDFFDHAETDQEGKSITIDAKPKLLV